MRIRKIQMNMEKESFFLLFLLQSYIPFLFSPWIFWHTCSHLFFRFITKNSAVNPRNIPFLSFPWQSWKSLRESFMANAITFYCPFFKKLPFFYLSVTSVFYGTLKKNFVDCVKTWFIIPVATKKRAPPILFSALGYFWKFWKNRLFWISIWKNGQMGDPIASRFIFF